MPSASRVPPLQIGAVLRRGRYTIERVLGEGGFGYVYLARDSQQNRQVAIKQCIDLESESVRQFGHEFAVLKMLAPLSSLFPQVYDEFSEQPQGSAPGSPRYEYGVMEFVPGKTLQDLLEDRTRRGQGPFGEAEVVGWTLQLLEALELAHKVNIIHRDIKPANIMLLLGDKQIKVIDVGIAKIGKAGDKTQGGALAASPGFAPVEQYAQAGRTDRGTDVYAVGATMYALLTGVTPVDAPARVNQPLPPPRQYNPALSPMIESVILRAMEVEIKQRYATAAEMTAALQGKSTTIACPSCGHPNPTTARFCQKCGYSFQAKALIVAGQQVYAVTALPDACDRAWDAGISLLLSGSLRQWLQSLGPAGASTLAVLDQVGAQYPTDLNLQLDGLLRFVQPQRQLPQLRVLPPQPAPVTLEQGHPHSATFTITNTGQGILAAAISSKDQWVTVKPAAVYCRPGEPPQVVQVILDSTNLAGTRSGRPYIAQVEVQSNGGSASHVYNVQVTAAPHLGVSPTSVDFGTVQHGQKRVQRTIQVANDGVGSLAANIQSTAAWLQVAPSSITLSSGQSQAVTLQAWPKGVDLPGAQTAEILVQAGADGTATVTATINVTGTFQLSADPSVVLQDLKDLIAWCDSHWRQAVQLLQSGELYAAARYIGPPTQGLLQRRVPQGWSTTLSKLQHVTAAQDLDVALETALRALGAAAPEFEHNWPEVEAAFGYGLMPQPSWLGLKKLPPVVEFRISNRSRGYLHGCLQPLVPWLSVDYPDFGCFPGQEARIAIRTNSRVRRTTGLRMKLVQLQIN